MINSKESNKKKKLHKLFSFLLGISFCILSLLILFGLAIISGLAYDSTNITILSLTYISFLSSGVSASFKFGKALKFGKEYEKTQYFLIGFLSSVYIFILIFYSNFGLNKIMPVIIVYFISVLMITTIPCMLYIDLFESPQWKKYYIISDWFSTYGVWIIFILNLSVTFILIPFLKHQIDISLLIVFYALTSFIAGLITYHLYTKSPEEIEEKRLNKKISDEDVAFFCLGCLIVIGLIIVIGLLLFRVI